MMSPAIYIININISHNSEFHSLFTKLKKKTKTNQLLPFKSSLQKVSTDDWQMPMNRNKNNISALTKARKKALELGGSDQRYSIHSRNH